MRRGSRCIASRARDTSGSRDRNPVALGSSIVARHMDVLCGRNCLTVSKGYCEVTTSAKSLDSVLS